MHTHATPRRRGATLSAQRTVLAHRAEAKDTPSLFVNAKLGGALTRRTGDPLVLKVYLKAAFGKEAHPRVLLGNLGIEGHRGFAKRFTGASAPIGTVACRLRNRHFGVLLGLLHQSKSVLGVGFIAGQIAHGHDDLAWLIAGDVGLAAGERLGGALSAMALLGIRHR